MRRMFSCSSSQVAVESWNKQDQKLLEAVEKGDVGRVSALAARKTARPAKLNAVGQSAFHLAASKGLTECLTLLLAHGAPVNEKNDDGSTALHLATIACQPQCVKVLLQYGANEGHVDGQNRTPLHWAASSGCASSVLLLCDHEALLDVTDAHGQTPLMLAARGNHAAICAQLLQRGADPDLADKDKKTALTLACERCSVEAAELLLSHGAALGDEDRRRYAAQTPNRALRRLLRRARGGGRENGSGRGEDSAPQGEGTPGSDSEEEEEEDDEDEEQRDGCDVRRLQERLARKTRQCQRLAATTEGLRQRVRELARLLPGHEAGEGTEDEDGACLTLLAQHLGELRKRRMAEEEGDGGGQTAARLDGDADGPALAPFLSWLGDECAKMRAAKASAFTRSKGLRKEVEDALRGKLHYEVVSAEAVRRSLAAWEKMAVGLEQALSRADDTHATMLEGSRVLLENLRREPPPPPPPPLTGAAPSRCPVNGTEPAAGGKSGEEPPREGGSLEKEVMELKESNGELLGELARLGRERERLQEELRALREKDAVAQPATESSGDAALSRALAAEREEARRLRRRLAGQRRELAAQRRELAALRDGVGEKAREAAGGDAGAGVLRELHRKLDGLVRSQHEALQLVAEMEGDGNPGDGDAGDGLAGELEDALGELAEELGTAAGPRVPRLMERLAGVAAALRGREVATEPAAAEAERWRATAAEAMRAAEAAEARAAEREREARALREAAEGLERGTGNLRDRAAQLATACRDKDGKMKQLLAETEKLSAEVLGLRGHNARLQLQLEVQQKNHRDIVAVYRTHLLHAAQGFMDEGVHAMLLRILRTEG